MNWKIHHNSLALIYKIFHIWMEKYWSLFSKAIDLALIEDLWKKWGWNIEECSEEKLQTTTAYSTLFILSSSSMDSHAMPCSSKPLTWMRMKLHHSLTCHISLWIANSAHPSHANLWMIQKPRKYKIKRWQQWPLIGAVKKSFFNLAIDPRFI